MVFSFARYFNFILPGYVSQPAIGAFAADILIFVYDAEKCYTSFQDYKYWGAKNMEQIGLIFRLIHFLGLAVLVCGILCQLTVKIRTVNWEMMVGASTQFVSGLALIGLQWPDVNLPRAGVKLALLFSILAIILICRKNELSKLWYSTILILALADIVLAVFWQ